MTHSRSTTRQRRSLSASLALLAAASTANAYSFTFTQNPTQCAQTTIQWSASDGAQPKFPLRFLAVPVGHLNPETRVIIDHTIDSSSSNSFTFPMTLPADSQFVAVLSDANGIGTGGTSAVMSVQSGDNSCISKSPSETDFFFYTNTNNPSQCGKLGITWDPTAKSPVSLIGVIPGGKSFKLADSPSGTAFDWTANVPSGTKMMIVAGDSGGLGTGGSNDLFTIGGGDSNCLNAQSPSSTSGSPAGGVSSAASVPSPTVSGSSSTNNPSATSSGSGSTPSGGDANQGGASQTGDGATTSPEPSHTGSKGGNVIGDPDGTPGSSSSKPIGAIVGGTIGGLALLGLLIGLLFFLRRRRGVAALGGRQTPDQETGFHDETRLLHGPGPHTWVTRGPTSHMRGGASQSVDSFDSMYRPKPFVMPASTSRPRHGRTPSSRPLKDDTIDEEPEISVPAAVVPVTDRKRSSAGPRRMSTQPTYSTPLAQSTRSASEATRDGHDAVTDPFADASDDVHIPPTYSSLRRKQPPRI